jgi:cell division protein FtsL
MMQASQDQLDRRQKTLLAIAWISIFAPLATFVYFTYQTYGLREQAQSLEASLEVQKKELAESEQNMLLAQRRRNELEQQIRQLDEQLLEKQRNLVHYRQFAGIRLRYYRESDRSIIDKVGASLSIPTELGQSPTINREPSAIVYGREVSEQDYRDIAIALVQEGFPLRSISLAKNRDEKLIQVIASIPVERKCGLLSIEQIRAGRTCGPITS